MTKQTIKTSSSVLRAKFRAAHSLVAFYEKRIHELRACVQTACVHRELPSVLREQLTKAIRAVSGKTFSGSLLIEDHARLVKRLGKGFQQRLDDSYACWQRCNQTVRALDQSPASLESERHALAAFGLATCEIFVIGILPVRKLRDRYAEQLCAKSARRRQKPRGRRADPRKPDRDQRIYVEYEAMEGRPGERYRQLAHKYRLEADTIRSIVRKQRQQSEKVGFNSSR